VRRLKGFRHHQVEPQLGGRTEVLRAQGRWLIMPPESSNEIFWSKKARSRRRIRKPVCYLVDSVGSNGFRRRKRLVWISFTFRVTKVRPVRLRGSGQQRIDDRQNVTLIQTTPNLRDSFVDRQYSLTERAQNLLKPIVHSSSLPRVSSLERSIPCRISPMTSTLRKSSSSSVARYRRSRWDHSVGPF
jgi:hypothetical protein